MKTIKITETKKDSKGLKTTISVNTEDVNVARKLLADVVDDNSTKERHNNTCSKSKQNNKQLVDKNKKEKQKDKIDANKMLPSPKINKNKLTRKSITGKAKITHITNNLDENLIHMSNSNSFNGKRGELLKKSYEEYRRKIEFSKLTNNQKKKLLDKLYKLYEPIVRYDSQWYSPMVSGPARYPQNKMDKIYERMMDANSKFINWWKSIENQINNSKVSKIESDKNEIEDVKKGFYRFYNQLVNNPENKHLASMAERYVIAALKVDTKLYKELFEKLNKVVNYRKNTNIYKAYKQVLDGNLSSEKIQKKDAEDNKVIFTCSDYIVRKVKIQAGDRIGIEFMFRPKNQLIYALKKRGFTWYSLKGLWICKPEKFDLEWAKNISKQYEKFIM